MNVVILSIFRYVPRATGLLAWVVLASSVLALLACVALGLAGHAPLPVEDPRLSPFRWLPLGDGLA